MKSRSVMLAAMLLVLAGSGAALFFLVFNPGKHDPGDAGRDSSSRSQEPETPLPVVRAFTVLRDTAAYVEPDEAAPRLYDVVAGSPLCSVDITQSGKWVASMTADGQPAWIKAENLGPFDKTAVPHADLLDSVAGTPTVVNSGVLQVGDRMVTLAGLSGLSGNYAQQMTDTIARSGNRVDCQRHGTGYTCKLPTGDDIGSLALGNGIAVDSGCITADYLKQEDAARAAPRGIWK